MNALLLAGGLGTRLRPLTETLPKPMAPVVNRPWLEHLVERLRDQGIRDIVIAVKHHPDKIRNHFGSGKKWGVNIRYAVEKTLLGTAGAIRNAEPFLDDRFAVFNADIVHDVNIASLVRFHETHGGLVTIGLTEVEDPSHYGAVEQDGEGRILRFVEKPKKEEAPSRRINAGIYVMEKRALAYIPTEREVSIERETFPLLIREGAGVYGTLIPGFWMDMGTRERYRTLHWEILNRKTGIPIPGEERSSGIWVGRNCRIGKGALLIPPVLIGDRAEIGDRSIIGPYAVVGPNCRLGSGVRCSETILWEGCVVRDETHLHQCVIGCGLEIGSRQIMHQAVMNRLGVMEA